MTQIKFTKHFIEKIDAPDPAGRQRLYWDTELKGFGVLVSGKTNNKTYVVQRQINRKTRRVTVGPTNVLTLDQARERAKQVLAEFYSGVDPKAKRRAEKQAGVTLRQLLDDYCKARKNLAANTVHEYKTSIQRYLTAWLDRPIRTITPDMVESRHREIQDEVMKGVYSKRKNLNEMASGHHAANGVMRYLRILWNFAGETMNDLPSNPVLRLRRRWYPEKRRTRHLKPLEIKPFYEATLALQNTVMRDYLILVLFTGLRRREAASLRWTDLDFPERVLRIPAMRTKAPYLRNIISPSPRPDPLHRVINAHFFAI